MVHIEDLSFSYHQKKIFTDLCLSLQKQGQYFLVGENGSGKSTFINLIGAWLQPQKGKVATSFSSISYLPASFSPNSYLRLQDICEIFQINWKQLQESTLFVGFELKSFSPQSYFGSLSSGERQKFLLSIILNKNAEAYLLDEPFNFLDWKARLVLINTLSKMRQSFLLIATHDFQSSVHFPDAHLLLVEEQRIHDLGLCKEALISEKFQNSFQFQTQIIDNPIDRTSILAVAEKS